MDGPAPTLGQALAIPPCGPNDALSYDHAAPSGTRLEVVAMMHDGMMGGWLIMVLVWLLVLGTIAVMVHLVYRAITAGERRPATRRRERSRSVLDERFARGEIDDEEYRRRLTTLERSGERPW